MSPPRLLLRLEGLALLAGAVVLYADGDRGWLLFALLFLAPDLSFAAYLGGPRAGALGYNAVHTLVGPVALGAVAVTTDWEPGVRLALIWLAHIGMDRALGYGLKYPTAFKDTHLNRV